MGCNLACFSPISSYGPFITGLIITELTAAGITANAWGLWGGMLKYNLYGLFAMVTVIIVAAFDINIGPMRKEEMRVRKEGKVMADGVQPLVPERKADFPQDYEPKIKSFALPLLALFLSSIIIHSANTNSRTRSSPGKDNIHKDGIDYIGTGNICAGR